MLEHTLDRATQLVGDERVVTVIRKRHRVFLSGTGLPGRVVEQPASKDTAPGLLFPASYILAEDPDALVHVFPSDHFIFPEDRFVQLMRHSAELVRVQPSRIVLMGAEPKGPETDYGWIQPGKALSKGARTISVTPREVAAFCEKPHQELADLLYAHGALWNTLIFSCRIQTLWQLAERYLPDVHRQFDRFVEVLPELKRQAPQFREQAISNLYATLPRANFSHRLLTRAARHCLVLPIMNVIWSDLGRPERVDRMLRFVSGGISKRLPVTASVTCNYEDRF
jgi:mannose-1-phosphate guanylyltransferase